jgi:hypothetical protein
MKSSDIINKSDNKSKSRAEKQNINAKLYKIDNNKIFYTVTSSDGDKQYLVTIQLANNTNSLEKALAGDIKVSCTCDAFLYQGYKYILWKANAGIDKETRSPDIRNPNKTGMACKHILVALNQIKSDYNKISELYNKSLKSKDNKQLATKVNDTVSQEDINIINKFKDACDKFYNSYNEFISNTDNESSFEDLYDGEDPSIILSKLSNAASKLLKNRFIDKFKSIDDIIKLANQKKQSFKLLVNSDVDFLNKKIKSIINNKTESLINNIILNFMLS